MADQDTGIHNIGSKADYQKAIDEPGVAIFDAYATWCGPCKALAPILVKMAKQYENARFYKFDVDELPDLAQELGISAMPTITVIKDGELVDKVRGANPPAIDALIQRALA